MPLAAWVFAVGWVSAIAFLVALVIYVDKHGWDRFE